MVSVEAQLDDLGRLSQEDDRFFVCHLRDRDVVDGDNLVAGSDAAVVEGGVTHEGAHVVPKDGFVLLAELSKVEEKKA